MGWSRQFRDHRPINLDTHEPKHFGSLGVEDFHEPLVFRSKCDLARTTDNGPAVCLTPLATINCSLDHRLACQLDENSLRSGGLPQAPSNIRASSRSKRLRNTSCRVPPKGIAVISIGSLGLRSRRSLIRRLLNTHEGIHSTPNLTDLSAAARARCIAYAAKHEDDWLTAGDESAAAQWRCLILAAEGHGPLIERLTDCLAKRRELKELRELQAKTIAQPQRMELAALLGAYARVMEGGRRRRPNPRGAGPDLSPG